MTVALEEVRNLPKKDSSILGRYAMWHPKLQRMASCRVCGRCSHCSSDCSPETRQRLLRSLHGECHCHPCGGLLPRRG